TVLSCVDSEPTDTAPYTSKVSTVTATYKIGTGPVQTISRTDICDGAKVTEYICRNSTFPQVFNITCSNGQSCAGGVCPAGQNPACSDTDGGKNYSARGTVTAAGYTYSMNDSCADANTLREWYCDSSNLPKSEVHDCPYTCTAGACSGGSSATCSDTDGGGNQQQYRFGKAVGINSLGVPFNERDQCVVGTNKVSEKYCNGAQVSTLTISCPTGKACLYGICLGNSPDCIDSDNSQNANVYGVVSKGDTAQQDTCVSNNDPGNADSSQVNEKYCSGNEIASTIVDCAADTYCLNGECVQYTCFDSDVNYGNAPWAPYFVRGYVSGYDPVSGYGTIYDNCSTDGSQVIERVCNANNQSATTGWPCAYGCVNGACLSGGMGDDEGETHPDSCTDSDNGQTFGTKGFVSGYKDNESFYVWDYCTGTLLTEQVCSGNQKGTPVPHDCTLDGKVCDDGKCVVSGGDNNGENFGGGNGGFGTGGTGGGTINAEQGSCNGCAFGCASSYSGDNCNSDPETCMGWYMSCFNACCMNIGSGTGTGTINFAGGTGGTGTGTTGGNGGTWTQWYNNDDPSGTGDWEEREDASGLCASPTAIECQTVGGVSWQAAGENYVCQVAKGGLCKRRAQPDQTCFDYKVRYFCPSTATN
ncbi:MAG: hypothetical protein ACP5N3_05120, partial [Candidatus Nanoarchaeia archaeon]